jgi:hypothetical protein
LKSYCNCFRCIPFLVALLLAIAFFAGCKKSSPHSDAVRPGNGQQSASSVAEGATPTEPVGGTYCVTTFEQGPAVSQKLHFSYKKNASDGSATDFEGDLLGDTFDTVIHEWHKATDIDREMNSIKGVTPTTIVDGFAENVHRNHFVRSDQSAWAMGSNGPSQAFTPWSLFIAKPDIRRAGLESVAGFSAVKYSVDTSHQDQMEKMALLLAGRLKDYSIEGNVWVDAKRHCILQYSVDYEEDGKDGSVKKTHYEGQTAVQ